MVERPFFERPETQKAIVRLADADRLTIIVGAGVSAEIGHPTWGELLTDLLTLAAQEVGLAADTPDVTAFVDWTMRQEGALGAAEVARALLKDSCNKAIQDSLYRDVPAGVLPGPSAQAIARLQRAVGTRCEIITTNYDVGIENALAELGIPFVSLTGPDSPGPGDAAVRHLHGIVRPHAKKPSGLVLSQGDYDSFDRTSWRYDLLVDRLHTTTCLFVGSGMSDPHLLHYLHRATPSSTSKHVAIMPRQADGWYDIHTADAVRNARERSLEARWKSVGVEVLRPDYFVQSAQFLYETLLQIEDGSSAQPYVARLDAWTASMEALLKPEDRTKFAQVQDDLTSELTQWLAGVRERISDAVAMPPSERLGLHLWARRTADHALFLWGSSDRSWRDPLTVEPVPIELPSAWTAVRAFCRGTPIRETNQVSMSRWNTLRGVPVMLFTGASRLPVGVLTLASTLPRKQSALVKIKAEVVDDLHKYLVTNAAQLLAPIVSP